jgi:hypothetical protein
MKYDVTVKDCCRIQCTNSENCSCDVFIGSQFLCHCISDSAIYHCRFVLDRYNAEYTDMNDVFMQMVRVSVYS